MNAILLRNNLLPSERFVLFNTSQYYRFVIDWFIEIWPLIWPDAGCGYTLVYQMKITKIFNKHEFVLLENTEGTIKNGQSRETDKQNKNTTQYVLDSTMHKQTQIT